jgi:hypothetical protein
VYGPVNWTWGYLHFVFRQHAQRALRLAKGYGERKGMDTQNARLRSRRAIPRKGNGGTNEMAYLASVHEGCKRCDEGDSPNECAQLDELVSEGSVVSERYSELYEGCMDLPTSPSFPRCLRRVEVLYVHRTRSYK